MKRAITIPASAMCFDNTLGAANERRHSKTI